MTEKRLSLYHVANRRHCDVQYDWPDRYGSGETEINKWEKEEAFEAAYKVLYDAYGEKYMAQQEPYVKGWEGDPQEHYNVTNISDMYESDLNNDGITERYLKAVKGLWMYETGFPSIGYGWGGLPHITGEYYGIHEGRHGLMYYIESEGEETDFFMISAAENEWIEDTEDDVTAVCEMMRAIDFTVEQPHMELTEEEDRAYKEAFLCMLKNELPIEGYPGGDYYEDLWMAGIPYEILKSC